MLFGDSVLIDAGHSPVEPLRSALGDVNDDGLDLPPLTVPVVKLLFAAPLGQPLHFVEA